MFGYVMANREALSEAEAARFQALYCGLCHSLRKRHGLRGGIVLSFDMTFLLLLLNALYEMPEESGEERCAMRPRRRHAYAATMLTDYAADMNVALFYHKLLDDWADDKNLLRRAEAALLKKGYRRVRALYPDKCEAIRRGILELSEIEKCAPDIDPPANCFGRMLGELFVYRGDHWAGTMRALGEALGKFIYVLDAYDDFEDDRKRGRYNPLLSLPEEGFEEAVHAALLMLIAEATRAFEMLPILQDAQLLRNILYSGVWTKYFSAQARRKGEKQ